MKKLKSQDTFAPRSDSGGSDNIDPGSPKVVYQLAQEFGCTETDVRIAAAAVGATKSKIRKYLDDRHLSHFYPEAVDPRGFSRKSDGSHLFDLFK